MRRATILCPEMPIRRLAASEIAAFVRDDLLSPARTRPVVAVTTNPNTPAAALDAERLAGDVGGAADVVAIETGEATWALTAALPSRLDVYGGAARIWWPGLTAASKPTDHPLLFVWNPDDVAQAWHLADRHHLHKPVVEQPQYNLFHRRRVERDYHRVVRDLGLGLTTFSPLAGGLLTGKYDQGIPPDSRATIKGYEWLAERLTHPERRAAVRRLAPVAAGLGCTLAQLSIAWCLANPQVSSVITGASCPSQIDDNLGALDVVPRISAEVRAAIDHALEGVIE